MLGRPQTVTGRSNYVLSRYVFSRSQCKGGRDGGTKPMQVLIAVILHGQARSTRNMEVPLKPPVSPPYLSKPLMPSRGDARHVALQALLSRGNNQLHRSQMPRSHLFCSCRHFPSFHVTSLVPPHALSPAPFRHKIPDIFTNSDENISKTPSCCCCCCLRAMDKYVLFMWWGVVCVRERVCKSV